MSEFKLIDNEKLLSSEYYINKLSLFLQNSYGICEHMHIFIDILNALYDGYNDFWKKYDITNYVTTVEWEREYDDSFLDDFGKIFNLDRTLNIRWYEDFDLSKSYTITKIKLTNLEYYVYICCTILKNNFDGTQGCIDEFFNRIKILNKVSIVYSTSITSKGFINAIGYFAVYSEEDDQGSIESVNLKQMFLNLKLAIKPLGVRLYPIFIEDNGSGYNYGKYNTDKYNGGN